MQMPRSLCGIFVGCINRNSAGLVLEWPTGEGRGKGSEGVWYMMRMLKVADMKPLEALQEPLSGLCCPP